MFCVNGSERGKAFTALACFEVNETEVLEMFNPQFLQNKEVPEFLVLQPGHFLCFRFFFSKANVTLSKSFSTLKFSSGIHDISVLRLPDNRSNERTARARNRKYSLLMPLA
jgi:hypothetical protein